MDHLRQIEEDLRSTGIECKKKYPEVADAADRALDSLKSLRETYVSEFRKKAAQSSEEKPKLPQSSDILAPYLLVCNYADGPTKLKTAALGGIRALLTYDLVPPSDVKNILRVLNIQGSSQKLEVQLKVLQVLLQMANYLSQNQDSAQHLTESIIFGFLALSLQLCGESACNVSVSNTAEGTVKQIVAMVMDGTQRQFSADLLEQPSGSCVAIPVTVDQASSKYSLSAIMVVREMCHFALGQPGEWIKGINVPQTTALDVIYEILSEWKFLFARVPFMRNLLLESLCPALQSLLKVLPASYYRRSMRSGSAAAGVYVSRVVSCVRRVLVCYARSDMMEQVEGLLTLLVQAMHPYQWDPWDCSADPSSEAEMLQTGSLAAQLGGGADSLGAQSGSSAHTLKSRWEEALQGGAGAFLRGFTSGAAGGAAAVGGGGKGPTGGTSTGGAGSKGGATSAAGLAAQAGFFVPLAAGRGLGGRGSLGASAPPTSGNHHPSAANGADGQLLAFPAVHCMEALVEFLCSDFQYLLWPAPIQSTDTHGDAKTARFAIRVGEKSLSLLERVLVSISQSATNLLLSACGVESNLRSLEAELGGAPGSALHPLLRALLSRSIKTEDGAPKSNAAAAVVGGEDGEKWTSSSSSGSSRTELKSLHEQLQGTASEALLLAFYLVQVVPRILLTFTVRSLSACAGSTQTSETKGRSSGGSGSGKSGLGGASSSAGARVVANIFLSPAAASALGDLPAAASYALTVDEDAKHRWSSSLHRMACRVCDYTYEGYLDCCSLVLSGSEQSSVIRAALSIVCELALLAELLHMPKQSEIILAVLCRFTVPIWHGQELCSMSVDGASPHYEGSATGTDRASSPTPHSPVRWRHYQALVRLLQVLHLAADSISDWDSIVDCMEQLVHYFSHFEPAAGTGSKHGYSAAAGAAGSSSSGPSTPAKAWGHNRGKVDPSGNSTNSGAGAAGKLSSGATTDAQSLGALEVEKIFSAIERFKVYTVFMSDDALVRLMTSLVALSMNNLAVHATAFERDQVDDPGAEAGVTGGGEAEPSGAPGDTRHADIIQVNSTAYGMVGSGSRGAGAGGLGGVGSGGAGVSGAMMMMSGDRAAAVRVRPDSSSAGLAYMAEGIRNGTVSFSLQAVIEITKLNAFRIATVWQMVISHLRMIASLKSAASRALSVAATHDVILSSLKYIQHPVSPLLLAKAAFLREELPVEASSGSGGGNASSSGAGVGGGGGMVMCDELLFGVLLPSFETTFVPRDLHRATLVNREEGTGAALTLSQSDLLSSLKALSAVRYSDVRRAIVVGLLQLLQGRGQIVSAGDAGGWTVILDLISSVPLSMTSESFMRDWCSVHPSNPASPSGGTNGEQLAGSPRPSTLPAADASAGGAQAVQGGEGELMNQLLDARQQPAVGSGSMASLSAVGIIPQYHWPGESLSAAFSCMKLIVDEFIEVLMSDCELVSAVLQGLALFGSQLRDVNISFTSVEMLWKVTDLTITAAVKGGRQLRLGGRPVSCDRFVGIVLEVMLKRLFQLSMDSRPEIRHCSMNTLFSAMASHAAIISSSQWQHVFCSIVFPLFEQAGARSRLAMWMKEEAQAPELKKGVKMSVHHSRDTAHKQWSETRVLALRGLSRVLRTCTRLLLLEAWFRSIWADAILICQHAMRAACEEQEVAVAALDVVFSMLKIIIQMDYSPTPAGSAATINSSSSIGSSNAVNRPRDKPSASLHAVAPSPVQDFEQVEASKQTLWYLTWTAVRHTAFYSCPSVDLALAISQRLAELYSSRADREFRYSDNIRVLLEVLVALVRPRMGLIVGGPGNTRVTAFAVDGAGDQVTLKQDRVTMNQLQRSVMDLIRQIRCTDQLAESCLVSTLAEISYGRLWVQAPSVGGTSTSSSSSSSSSSSAPGIPGAALSFPIMEAGTPGESYANSNESADGHSSTSSGELLILGSTLERIREESTQHLLSALRVLSPSTKECLTTPHGSKESLLPSLTKPSSAVVDTVLRRFVGDLCESALLNRCRRHAEEMAAAAAAVAAPSLAEAKPDKIEPSQAVGAGSFFSSLGAMMSSRFGATPASEGAALPSAEATVAASPAATVQAFRQALRKAGGAFHQFDKHEPSVLPFPDWTSTKLGAAPFPYRSVPICRLKQGSGGSDDVWDKQTGSVAGNWGWSSFMVLDKEVQMLQQASETLHALSSARAAAAALPAGGVPGGPAQGNDGQQATAARGFAKTEQIDTKAGAGAGGTGQGEEVPESQWSCLLIAVACLTSPWRQPGEVFPFPGSELEGEAAVAQEASCAEGTAAIISCMANILSTYRYPPSCALTFINVLASSMHLSFSCLVGAALGECGVPTEAGGVRPGPGSGPGSSSQVHRAVQFYLPGWRAAGAALETIASASCAPPSVRSRALQSLIKISQVVIQYTLQACREPSLASASIFASGGAIARICVDFMRLLKRCESALELLPPPAEVQTVGPPSAAGKGDDNATREAQRCLEGDWLAAVLQAAAGDVQMQQMRQQRQRGAEYEEEDVDGTPHRRKTGDAGADAEAAAALGRGRSQGGRTSFGGGHRVEPAHGGYTGGAQDGTSAAAGSLAADNSAAIGSASWHFGPCQLGTASRDVTGGRQFHLQTKGHLLLIMPLCIDLVLHCTVSEIRQEASSIVSSIDMGHITAVLNGLASENRTLQTKNRRLQAELQSARSAAALPF